MDGDGQQEHPRDPLGTAPGWRSPGHGAAARSISKLWGVLGRNLWPDGFACLDCSWEERWLLWAAGDRRESVTPKEAAGFEPLPRRSPTWEPGDGKREAGSG